MGDRYFLAVTCPECKTEDPDVYYAPTCGFVDWICSECGCIVDLEEWAGISYEDCSNADLIEELIENLAREKEAENENNNALTVAMILQMRRDGKLDVDRIDKVLVDYYEKEGI